MKHTFLKGPLDPSRKPPKFIQVFVSDGIDTVDKPDQVDRSIKAGTYELGAVTTQGPIYEWKGPTQ